MKFQLVLFIYLFYQAAKPISASSIYTNNAPIEDSKENPLLPDPVFRQLPNGIGPNQQISLRFYVPEALYDKPFEVISIGTGTTEQSYQNGCDIALNLTSLSWVADSEGTEYPELLVHSRVGNNWVGGQHYYDWVEATQTCVYTIKIFEGYFRIYLDDRYMGTYYHRVQLNQIRSVYTKTILPLSINLTTLTPVSPSSYQVVPYFHSFGDPNVGYIGSVQEIFVRGFVPQSTMEFLIYLGSGTSKASYETCDVDLGINPKFYAESSGAGNKIVVRSRKGENWSAGVRYSNTLSFGTLFTFQIFISPRNFTIHLNGTHLGTFVHNKQVNIVRSVFIDGGVLLETVDYSKRHVMRIRY